MLDDFPSHPLSINPMKSLRRTSALGLALLLCVLTAPLAFGQGVPGSVSADFVPMSLSKSSGTAALTPTVTETGLLSLSIDGCGTAGSSCTVDVDKPAGATVRGAYLAASTNNAFVIPDGFVTLAGAPINWDQQVSTDAGGFNSNFFSSHFDDVTSIVAPIINAAAAGLTSLTVTGQNNDSIDGVTLVVIFDDPNQTNVGTAVLAFGGQATSGDTFNIGLAQPFDALTQHIELSLAIGFSNQAGNQYSLIDVNGTRMTSSAGNYDDGAAANGALYTVGGLGDDPANPTDPTSTSFDDDELYTLDPFIPTGATNVTVFSQNPSNDDIIHLATFLIQGTAAIVGEGILLTPLTATNPVNTNHTVTALVQDDNGAPISGRTVDFEIISGPNAGLTGSDVSDGDGEATFTWSSSTAGTDVVVARFVSSRQQTITSNSASKTWMAGGDTCQDPSLAPSYAGGYVLNAAGTRAFVVVNAPRGAEQVRFYNMTNLNVGDPETNAEDGVLVGYDNRTGATFDFSSDPMVLYFPITPGGSGTQVSFFVEIVDECGSVDVDPVFVVTGLSREALSGFALASAAPSPTTGSATIRFSLDVAGEATLAVYDVLGREVARLVDGSMAAGTHEASFEGASLPSGLYLYRLTAGGQTLQKTLTIAR